MYFCSEFMEICKPIHFWKAYNARSPKNNVYICAAPLTLVATATKIWEFQHKISCIWGNIRDYNGASCTKLGVYKIRQFNGVIEI